LKQKMFYDASMSSRSPLPESATGTITGSETPRRPYKSTRRALQAAQTRDDVLAAAIRLFSTAGWAGTTITAVATEAGVAVETIYSGFGSKKALLRAAMDVAVVGDAEPIPFVERDEYLRLGRGSIAERMRAGVEVVAAVHERSAGVWRAIMEAAVADAEIDGWRIELERGRRLEIARSLALMTGRDLDDRTVDLMWILLGPEVYLKLTGDAGLTRSDYQSYVLDGFQRLTARARPSRRTV
jgi:AcrR family transcriptional regulator